MLDDTATSSAVTSSRDGCDSDVIRTNNVIDDTPAVSGDVSQVSVGEHDVSAAAAEYVDVSSTSSLTSISRAGGTDAASVDRSRLGQRSECRVCGDDAAGMYFGALVCVPCKVSYL